MTAEEAGGRRRNSDERSRHGFESRSRVSSWLAVGLVRRGLLVQHGTGDTPDGSATAWQILFFRSLSLTPFVFLVIVARSGGRPFPAIRAAGISAILAALGFALFTIALRWKRSEDMMPAAFFAGIFTVIVAGGMCLATGQSFGLPIFDLTLALGLGIFQIGAGLTLYTMGASSVPAEELVLLSTIEVVLGPFWVWLLLGETGGPYTLLGGAILICAICGNAVSGRYDPRAEQIVRVRRGFARWLHGYSPSLSREQRITSER